MASDAENKPMIHSSGSSSESKRMQGYGAVGSSGGNPKAGEAFGYPATPSAPPDFESNQGYPASPSAGGYPPGSYPPASGGYPPGSYPPTSGGYPPGNYPPAPGGYPPGSNPPTSGGYPPGSNPPTSGGYPPGSYPPGPSYPSAPPGGPPGYQAGGGQGAGGSDAPPFAPPPPGFLDPVPGYDSITFDDIPILPPSYDDVVRPMEPKDRKPLSGVAVISQEQARSAMLEHCSAHCCYGSTAARDMIISNMSSTSAFHYTLETFTEKRATAWAQVPYTGRELLDTAMNGPAPLPWDIPLHASAKFKTEIRKVEVPHTAVVKPCHNCHGSGYRTCMSCSGRGRTHCHSCSGSGRQRMGSDVQTCSFCHGSGHRHCFQCSGSGRIMCNHCRGHGKLKWFIQLTVAWTNHFEDYILERTAMPDELIRKASGETAFQEEQPWLYPVNHCPEPTVNRASNELIEKHRKAFPSERQLIQRHAIRIVPVTEVHAQWKQKPFTFFVYGLEHLVHTSDYPQMCCCGCTIL